MIMQNVTTLPPWKDFFNSLNDILSKLSFSDASGKELTVEQGFALWNNKTLEAKKDRRYLYFIGNGASASLSSHFSADLAKNAQILTQVFTDMALITAMANDESYEDVFARPLADRGRQGDILISISSSGNSTNIVKAIQIAKEMEIFVVTLSAMQKDNYSRLNGDLNVYVPAPTFGLAESAHAAILHHWTDAILHINKKHSTAN